MQGIVGVDVLQTALRRMATELLDIGISIPGANPPQQREELKAPIDPRRHHYIAAEERYPVYIHELMSRDDDPAYAVSLEGYISIGR